MKKQRLMKFVGYFSTLVFVIVGIAPSILKIPVVFHPWFLLFSILWVVVFSSGVFSS